MFKPITQIQSECSAAAQEAKREYRRDVREGLVFPRGRYISICAVVDGKEVQVIEGESWRWDGTLKDLNRAVALANREHPTGKIKKVSIFGGFNWAESLRAYQDNNYDPLVAEWEIVATIEGTKVFDVWRDHYGKITAVEATKEFVTDADAPYGFNYHEIRVEAHDRRQAIAKAKSK